MLYKHPKIERPRYQFLQRDEVYQLLHSKHHFSVFQASDGCINVMFSTDGEDLYSTLLVAAMNHPRLFAMIKAVVIAGEKLIKNPEIGMQLATACSKYFFHNPIKK